MDLKPDRGASTTNVSVRYVGDRPHSSRVPGVASDVVAVEEPMEIRVESGPLAGRLARSVSVTMRTPGHDFELALGFLHGEGLISGKEDVIHVDFCGPPAPDREQSNIVRVELNTSIELDLVKLQRNFYSTSSCGICGKASLEALNFEGYNEMDGSTPSLRASVIHTLPDKLRAAQAVFDKTGGLHAAGIFDVGGELLLCREDVGRHNAVDKLIGHELLAGRVPLAERLLVVSGRVSFEILQKALAAGLPVIVAVGAPSSLAIQMAERFGMTLIGFARDQRFNVYAGQERLVA